jgi:dipeptidase E
MKLVLYSGGDDNDNLVLDKELVKLSNKSNPTITFIPSSSYFIESEFLEFASQFQKYRVNRLINFPVDVEFSEVLKKEVLKSDIIYLGGGNTFYFLKHLRQSNMMQDLKDFVSRGGILAGLSAGAILMTPTIGLAGEPHFDRDDNDDNMKNLKSLGLLKFEFFPHYKNSMRYDKALKNYSLRSKRRVYASADGCGIIVDGENIKFIGKTFLFHDGVKIQIK